MPKFAILVEGAFNHLNAKTGNAMLRYRLNDVVCCIDSYSAGRTTHEIIGIGGKTPVVADVASSLSYNPDTLLVGVATPGGFLPNNMRKSVSDAIRAGLDIVCGLHEFISEDKEFSALAQKHKVTLTDLRKPPFPLPFTKGSWKQRKTPVLLTVGSDCDTGKMTAAWEIMQTLNGRGIKTAFVGTGQTGKLLSGAGVAVDAVISDFVAGVVETEIDKLGDNFDLIVVEGQGSVTHMAYSGVTLSLLHGAMPDMLIMCHEPARVLDVIDHPIPPLAEILDLYLLLVRVFKPCVCAGISLITYSEPNETALHHIHNIGKQTNFPTNDLIRYGGDNIIENIIQLLHQRVT